MKKISQFYIDELKPSSNSAKDLFEYCVKYANEKNLLSESYNHIQWAAKLFGYQKNSHMRLDYMSKVKREYSNYFTHSTKYSFDEDKIKRDFPFLLGIEEESKDGDYTSEDLIYDSIEALDKEIEEEKSPDNIESFKGEDLSMIRKQGNSYIYKVYLVLSDGQEPHFHDGIPFVLKVYGKRIICEAVEFDYESGHLFFTTNRRLSSASYCTVLMDSTFILEGLKERLLEIVRNGVDEDLPYAKFFFDETEDLKRIDHKPVPGEFKSQLDHSQKRAFEAAMNNDITFIWGPPGTGKSFTLASIIYTLYILGEDRTAVCCLSNVAVDQLLCKVLDIIDDYGTHIEPGNIYRAGRTMDKRIVGTDYLFPKDVETNNLRRQIKNNLEKLQRYKDRKREMSEEAIALKAENRELREELKEKTDYLVNNSRVVFSTISNFVLSKRLRDSKFDNLIVDEASMLAMPSLIALGSNITKRLILVGDFQQLSPIAIVKDENLTDSVFDMTEINISNTKHPALHQLLNQRRSNEKIVDLINNTFYKGKLIPKAKEDTKFVDSFPFKGRVISSKKVEDGAVRFTKGGTRQNKMFATADISILDEFYKSKLKCTIGIITPYRGQVALLRALKYEKGYPEEFNNRVKIGTIHTFQGSECDVIIYDMVDCSKLESGNKSRIGRLYSGKAGERLLNVALSRAKHKLIIVCEPDFISNIPGNTISDKTRSIFTKLSRFNS